VLSSVIGRNRILNGKGTETIAGDDGKGGEMERVVKDEEKKTKGILREMKIVPRKVEHFD